MSSEAALKRDHQEIDLEQQTQAHHTQVHHNHHDGSATDSHSMPKSVGAAGAEMESSPYNPRTFANPAPIGLCGFAMTTFLLSFINVSTRGVMQPNIVVGLAFAYGGLIQLLAGMWEVACGNTFGAVAFSSYGGFWISLAIVLTPAFAVTTPYSAEAFESAFGLYLICWFIFTFLLLICTTRSSIAFFGLFLTLDLAFLMLAIGRFKLVSGAPNVSFTKAGGAFGFMSAILAWYVALAGIATRENSFVKVPLGEFPWNAELQKRKNH